INGLETAPAVFHGQRFLRPLDRKPRELKLPVEGHVAIRNAVDSRGEIDAGVREPGGREVGEYMSDPAIGKLTRRRQLNESPAFPDFLDGLARTGVEGSFRIAAFFVDKIRRRVHPRQ